MSLILRCPFCGKSERPIISGDGGFSYSACNECHAIALGRLAIADLVVMCSAIINDLERDYINDGKHIATLHVLSLRRLLVEALKEIDLYTDEIDM